MHLSTVSAVLACVSTAVSAAEPVAGLLFVKTKPNHPDLTDQVFNEWYSNEHIHDMAKSGLTDLIVRYKNVNKTAAWPYLAIYRLPDVAKLQDQKLMASIPTTSKLLPGKAKGSKGGVWKEVVAAEMTPYRRTQTFEGQIPRPGRGKGIVTVTTEPAVGGDKDYDDWYRLQHLDMLSMLNNYRRSTRYQKLDNSSPKYLAMHELDTPAFPPEIRLVLGTQWSKKNIGTARSFGSDTWEYITELGKGAKGEKF